MFLSKSHYTAIDAIRLTFKASPICAFSHFILTILRAVIPTALAALVMAGFIDTAAAILQGTAPRGDIYLPLALLILVLGIRNTLVPIAQLAAARIRLQLRRKLNPAMVYKHAALDFKHIENAESWELISRVSRDPSDAVMRGFDGFMDFVRILMSVVAILGLIIVQVWWAALAILAFSLPLFRLAAWAGKKNYQAGRESEKFNRRHEYLGEVLTGRENIDERSLFAYADAVTEDWRGQFEAGRILRLAVMIKMFVVIKASSMTLGLISLLVALTLINPVIGGYMSAGMYMGIVTAVFGLVQMLGWTMSDSLEQISRASEYMKDLSGFIALSGSEGALAEPAAEPLPFSSLEFRNVRFKYPTGDGYILDGLSFTLDGGRHYAFVGKNGAGKTTITKLLTGLYREYDGEILINGKELREYADGDLKAMFSVVYQDFARVFYFVSG